MAKNREKAGVGEPVRIGVFGASGTGKTTKAREIVSRTSRLIVFDPLDAWGREFKGLRRIAGMKSLEAAMRKDFTGGFKYLYVPTFGAEVEELDQLCYLLVAANAGYAQGQHQAKTTLVVDELDQSFPSGITQRNPRNGFAYLCRRGRHYGINLVGISQRTAQVDVCFRGNLSGAYYFRHADQLDIDKAVQTLGRQYRAQMQGLKNFCYIYQSNGVVNIKNN